MRTPAPIPQDVTSWARHQEGLVSTAQCRESGLTPQRLSRLVAQGRLVRVTRGVLDTDAVPPARRVREDYFDHLRRRTAWIGLLALGPSAVAVGTSSIALHRVQGLPLDCPAEVSAPDGAYRRPRAGIRVRQYEPMPVSRLGSWKVARLDHAIAQSASALDRDSLVAVLDSAVNCGQLRHADVPLVHDLARCRPGTGHTHRWWALVDGRAESPAESVARLSCLDHGVPPDDLQVEFFEEGRFLARSDLGWLLPDGRWVVAEIDGVGPHTRPRALAQDGPRQNGLIRTDRIVVLRFRPRDGERSGGIGAQVADVLHRLGWRPGSQVPQGLPVHLTRTRTTFVPGTGR